MNPNIYYTLNPANINYKFQPNALISQQIQQESNLNSNWKYRQYMQKNANQIMKYNTMEAVYSSGNNPYTISNESVNSSPILFNTIHDNSNYNNSDLKNSFLTKQQFNSRLISPYISTNFKK
jgi:hypothetical protein